MASKRPTEAQLLTAQRYRLIEKSIDALKIPGYLLMSWVPLQPISQIMADLAGKDTQVNVPCRPR